MREAQGNVTPHVMGPESISTSGSAVAARNAMLPHADQKGDVRNKFKMLDITTVIYSEVTAREVM